MGDVSSAVQNTVFPQKGKVMPPHTIVGVLNFCSLAVAVEGASLSKSELEFLINLGTDSLTKISDPKV